MYIQRSISLLLTVFLLSGCTSIKRQPPPPDVLTIAQISGIPGCRIWGDNPPENEAERRAIALEQLELTAEFNPKDSLYILAISGGAQEGAFGAGVLTGWTANGTRPEFDVVTGISSGSILAPFAFLGPDYDDVLHDMFSKYDTGDIIDTRYFSALFRGESISSNKKLKAILKKYFTPVEMEKVAQEYKNGRRLFIGSTHLDSVRPVIWDIGAIASSGDPKAYDLIIDIILASTAFPGVFPPILFNVEQGGKPYQELHVDGGLTSQVFAYALDTDIRRTLNKLGIQGKCHVYVLRNAIIVPRVKEVSPSTIPILKQTAFSMVNAMALMNLQYIYKDSVDNGLEFHLAYIPSDFRDSDKMYDPLYMEDLYRMAFNKAKKGYPWDTKPPEYEGLPTRAIDK